MCKREEIGAHGGAPVRRPPTRHSWLINSRAATIAAQPLLCLKNDKRFARSDAAGGGGQGRRAAAQEEHTSCWLNSEGWEEESR